jgi:hypothetical protein
MTSAEQLEGFIDKFTPDVAAIARAALAKMRARLPGAVMPVYDNYNALAIGFGPTERVSDLVFSLAIYPRWVSLFFAGGVALSDPDGLLAGSGGVMRHIRLSHAEDLDLPGVRALMQQAIELAGQPFDAAAEGRLVIKSISAKQRPRRP